MRIHPKEPLGAQRGRGERPHVTVEGTLNSTAGSTFRIDFFAHTECNPSGHGEGFALLRGLGANGEAFLLQGGAGATYRWREDLGFRLDARVLQVDDLLGLGSTSNFQAGAGLVFYFA